MILRALQRPVPVEPCGLAADGVFQGAYGCDAGGVGDLHHAVDRTGDEAGLHAGAADALDAGAAVAGDVGVAGGPALEEAGVLGVRDTDTGVVLHVVDVAGDGRGGAAGTGGGDDPGGLGEALQLELTEDGFGDVVVASPVRGPLGVGELVHVVAAGLHSEASRLLVHLPGVVHEVTAAPVELDQTDLLGAGRAGHDGDEGDADQLGEVRLGDGSGATGGLDDGAVRPDPAVAQAVEEEGAGETVFEAAGGVGRLVLEVQVDAPSLGQREAQQMGVGGAVGVGLDLAHGFFEPGAVLAVTVIDVEGRARTGGAGVFTACSSRIAPTADRGVGHPDDKHLPHASHLHKHAFEHLKDTPVAGMRGAHGGRMPRMRRNPAPGPPCALVLDAGDVQTSPHGPGGHRLGRPGGAASGTLDQGPRRITRHRTAEAH